MRDPRNDNNDVECMYFQDDGMIPNHPHLPVLLYKGVWHTEPAGAESRFNRNGWANSWVNGVFDVHHYHSNARGSCRNQWIREVDYRW